jgi:S1-C subfamily serine protease
VAVPGDLLDLILIAVIAAFAVAGYRQGFIIGVLSLVGFVAGIALGAYIAPGLSRALASRPSWQAFLAILVVFITAVIGMLIASGIGVAVRSRLNGFRQVTIADSLGGAVVNVIAVVIVAWLIGSFVVNSPQFPAVARQVSNSAVLRTVDKVMPRSALYLPMFPQLRSLISNGLYSQVFDAIGPQSAAGLAAPNQAVLSSPALATDEQSIVKVTGDATSCSLTIEGSGFVISPGHVLTNAHVVAGVDSGQTVTTAGGVSHPARVVLYDPETDLAVLDVPGLTARPLAFTGPPPAGTDGIVAGYPLSDPYKTVPATIGLAFEATGPDIYSTQSVTRQIYDIRALIQPGNSGGPLLSTGGQVYGVVFAASTNNLGTGFALTASQVATDVAAGRQRSVAVATGACQDG